ncbi:hypothetical protein L1785_18870 [Antribacter sp. KLBMP9083]|uniref:Uncharacterized protein n=1 Tax=Antribacter soli TaxID=2910976 RepID=A0AA41QIW4_9MICO|nr:hypothetical protein [Antribacter soli]MCF4123042.1 hypothetical protein [Antribacter soli]
MLWFSRPRLPDDVRRALRAQGADTPLAQAALADGSWAVATRAALATTSTPPASAPEGGRTVVVHRPWCDVDRASFEPTDGVLTVEWVDREPALLLPLEPEQRTSLPQVVRERVQWSVVHAEPVALAGGRSARVAVRRTADGEIFSQAIAGPGVDLDDPAVADVIDAAEARVRNAAGLPA